MPISSSSSSFGSAGDLGRLPPLHELGEHRGRGLRDRAAAAFEADLVDRLAVVAEADEDRHLVAAERVLALGVRVGGSSAPCPRGFL